MRLSPHTILKGRPVIILDDVLDTGETAVFTAKQLRSLGATDIDLCVLIKKQKGTV
jgi:hypoxanthine-guanine phosphoribosyltransferase